MEKTLVIPILLSFFITLIFLPKWIKKCHITGLLWEDMNKYNHPKNVASSGGLVVVMGFLLGVLSYIAIKTFILHTDVVTVQIFGLLCMILILAIVGLTDDLLGWQHGGLSKRFRLFLVLFASIPLVVINAGNDSINIPGMGYVYIGLLYTLVAIPIGVIGATTTYNFLAGFNGLESGQGIIIISFLSFIAALTGATWLALIGLIMVAALIAFYYYNKDPAAVFPGDILTYSIGGLIAAMAILGNFERIAVFIFIPYIIEVVLKLRGRLKKQSFGKPNKDGTLDLPYDKIYGLTHLSIYILKKLNIRATEKNVTYLIFSFQIIICIIGFFIFKNSILNGAVL